MAPIIFAMFGYTTKKGSGMMNSSPGSSSASAASISPPLVPLVKGGTDSQKEQAAAECGVATRVLQLPATATQEEVLEQVHLLNSVRPFQFKRSFRSPFDLRSISLCAR